MDKLLIRGGRTLGGVVPISGAKNAALPELCASLLTSETVTLDNVPHLQDVNTMTRLIRNMGVSIERGDDDAVRIDASTLTSPEAPYELVKTMRASVLALGPLLARFGGDEFVAIIDGTAAEGVAAAERVRAEVVVDLAVGIQPGLLLVPARGFNRRQIAAFQQLARDVGH